MSALSSVRDSMVNMFNDYLKTTKTITNAWGEDQDIYIPGYGVVNGKDSMEMMSASELYREVYFSSGFSQVMKNMYAVRDMEKQINSSLG